MQALTGLSGLSGIVTATPTFTPASLPGLALWLKADGTRWQDSARTTPAVADSDPVGCWDDASGLGNHVKQATSTKRPSLKLGVQNGMPAVRFDGIADFLTAASTLTGDLPISICAVCAPRRSGFRWKKEAPPGFEPGMADLQSADASTQPHGTSSTSANDAERLAFCLALLSQKSTDLALLVERWEVLPDALRAGIVAMVKAATGEA